jgi:hypothetical protein
MAQLRMVMISGSEFAIILGRVRVARLMDCPWDHMMAVRAILPTDHMPEIRVRCGKCGSMLTGGSLAGELFCLGDVAGRFGGTDACHAPKIIGEDAPERRWYVVRTAFHGGGIISTHGTLGAAHRACRAWAAGDCTCGCAGVVEAADYNGLETQDRNQSWSHNPYALTRY